MEQQLYDIYEMWYVPFWQTTQFYVGIVVSIVVLVGIISYVIFKRRQKNKVAVNPWVYALQQLEKIEKSSIGTREQAARAYLHMTMVLKEYAQHRFEGSWQSYTDDEVVEQLARVLSDAELKELLAGLFVRSSQVKFARADALEEQIKKDITLSKRFVNDTIVKKETESV